MFRFKIDLQRLSSVDTIADVDQWGLESKHHLPSIDLFSQSYNPYIAKIGWNPQGLFLQIELDLSGRKRSSSRPYELQVTLLVNSRFDPSILRENEFCSRFVFLKTHRSTIDFKQLDLSGNERLRCSSMEDSFIKNLQNKTNTEPVFCSFRSSSKGLTFWIHLAGAVLNGYRPEEFPEIGLHFDVMVVDPDFQGNPMIWNMVYSYQITPRGNPSLWTHCRLV